MDSALPLTARYIPSNYRLRLPGPAAIPERVRAATALPILSHRGPEFRGILDEVTTLIRGVLGTTQEVFLLGGSGTAGMEAALVNVLSAGDAVLVIENGQFGERFSSIAEGLPVQLDRVPIPWGEVPDCSRDRRAREGEGLSCRCRRSQRECDRRRCRPCFDRRRAARQRNAAGGRFRQRRWRHRDADG